MWFTYSTEVRSYPDVDFVFGPVLVTSECDDSPVIIQISAVQPGVVISSSRRQLNNLLTMASAKKGQNQTK